MVVVGDSVVLYVHYDDADERHRQYAHGHGRIYLISFYIPAHVLAEADELMLP